MSDDESTPASDQPVPVRPWRRGAVVGLVTAVAALGSAELVAGLDRGFASPVTQVGSRVIDAAPPWLKTFAIETFGANDKTALLIGIGVVLAVAAVLLGRWSARAPRAAALGAAGFGAVGVAASLAGVGGVRSAVPSLVGGLVAVGVLAALAARAWPTDRQLADAPGAQPTPAPSVELEQDRPGAESPTVHSVTGPRSQDPHDRRTFLRVATVVGVVGASAATTGRWLRTRFDAAVERARVVLPRAASPLPDLDVASYQVDVEGVTPFLTPADDFYRVDTALELPQVQLDTWRLRIGGMVDRELTFSFDELLDRDLVEADVTLVCVSNEVGGQLAGTARWLGVPLRDLLAEAGVESGADQIIGRSVDGYTCGFPVTALDDERTALVVVGMNGEPLPVERGFPARLLVAGLYGYVSATKWLTEIELTTFERTEQYWVPRGWSAEAPIKTFSRIDTPAGLGRVPAGRVPVAGVAWAPTRQVRSVEVRVDDGAWTAAELRPVPNAETWCQWVLPVDLARGNHTITCRATDGSGTTQTEERAAPRPDGATGWHSVVVTAT